MDTERDEHDDTTELDTTDPTPAPDFSDAGSTLRWWASHTSRNFNLMRREKASTRQRLLNDTLDSWTRARKALADSELIEELRAQLDDLRATVERRAN